MRKACTLTRLKCKNIDWVTQHLVISADENKIKKSLKNNEELAAYE